LKLSIKDISHAVHSILERSFNFKYYMNQIELSSNEALQIKKKKQILVGKNYHSSITNKELVSGGLIIHLIVHTIFY
jgi:hypothetical protein